MKWGSHIWPHLFTEARKETNSKVGQLCHNKNIIFVTVKRHSTAPSAMEAIARRYAIKSS